MNTPETKQAAERPAQMHARRTREHSVKIATLSMALSVALKEPYEPGAAEQLREVADFILDQERALERAEAEIAEWRTLCAWGGTPEIIHQWIKGQQERIYACQDLEQQLAAAQRLADGARADSRRLGTLEAMVRQLPCGITIKRTWVSEYTWEWRLKWNDRDDPSTAALILDAAAKIAEIRARDGTCDKSADDWTACDKRLPTIEDADDTGQVWWWCPEHADHGPQRDTWTQPEGATHWMRLVSIDLKPKPPIAARDRAGLGGAV